MENRLIDQVDEKENMRPKLHVNNNERKNMNDKSELKTNNRPDMRPEVHNPTNKKSTGELVNKMQIKNMNLYYGDFLAVKDLDLDIIKNQALAFIGPSGCGKSSTLKCLNRMNDLVEGARVEGLLTLDGEDIYSKKFDVNELRKRVGMVFQTPTPFSMSIQDNITFGPKTHGIKKKADLEEIVEKSLIQANLWEEVKDDLRKNALELSGGQQQRLCIARALAVEPEVILMDEPTSALDPISTGKIEELVMDLKQKYTIVIVTHNIGQASRVTDRTAFFLNGVMVEVGDTAELFMSPKDKRTEDYITGRFG